MVGAPAYLSVLRSCGASAALNCITSSNARTWGDWTRTGPTAGSAHAAPAAAPILRDGKACYVPRGQR